MKKIVACCFLIFFIFNETRGQDAAKILKSVNEIFQKVNDYTADVRIKTDISFVNILPVNAKVFFKQPDKFHIQSKGIAILPKQGPGNMLYSLRDTAAFTSFLIAKENLDGVDVAVINLLPISDTNDIVVGKFWIDIQRNVVLKSQITSKTNGTVNAQYTYGQNISYALPDKILFIIDTKKFKMPKAVAADINNYAKDKAEKENDNKGKITLTFSNYTINKGIADSVFKRK